MFDGMPNVPFPLHQQHGSAGKGTGHGEILEMIAIEIPYDNGNRTTSGAKD
jgi:hypothetical protein